MKNKELTIGGETFRFLTSTDIEKLAEQGQKIYVTTYFGIQIETTDPTHRWVYKTTEDCLLHFSQVSYIRQREKTILEQIYTKSSPDVRHAWQQIAAILYDEDVGYHATDPHMYDFAQAVVNYQGPLRHHLISSTAEEIRDCLGDIDEGIGENFLDDFFVDLDQIDFLSSNCSQELYELIRTYYGLFEQYTTVDDLEEMFTQIDFLFQEDAYNALYLLQDLIEKKRHQGDD